MFTANLDTQDCLINIQMGNISYNEFAQGSAWKVYAKFCDEQAGSDAIRSSYLGRQTLGFLLKYVELRFQ